MRTFPLSMFDRAGCFMAVLLACMLPPVASQTASAAPPNPFRPDVPAAAEKQDRSSRSLTNPFRSDDDTDHVQPASFQHPSIGQPAPSNNGAAPHPCAALADEKPLWQLGIDVAEVPGEFPADEAALCWDHVNQLAGPLAGARFWAPFVHQWKATSLCHRPLYFEEINLERHGYGCGDCLQPLASAAHFFATVPALPYCMAVDCPHDCIYTLGHYRPGSCPPWRHHCPPFDPVAAVTSGGVWTGMVFLIP